MNNELVKQVTLHTDASGTKEAWTVPYVYSHGKLEELAGCGDLLFAEQEDYTFPVGIWPTSVILNEDNVAVAAVVFVWEEKFRGVTLHTKGLCVLSDDLASLKEVFNIWQKNV